MSDHISLYASMEVSRIKKKVKQKVLFETDTYGNLFVPNICTLQRSQPLDPQKSVHICQNLVISFPVTFLMTVHYSNHFHAINSTLCPLTVSVQMGKTPNLNLCSNISMLVTKGRLNLCSFRFDRGQNEKWLEHSKAHLQWLAFTSQVILLTGSTACQNSSASWGLGTKTQTSVEEFSHSNAKSIFSIFPLCFQVFSPRTSSSPFSERTL